MLINKGLSIIFKCMVSWYCIQHVYAKLLWAVMCIICIFSMIYQIPSASVFWILCLNLKSFSFPCFPLTEMAYFSYWFDLTSYGFCFIWLLFKDVCILTFWAYLLCTTTYKLIFFVLFSVVWVPFLHIEYPDWQPFIIETFFPLLISF